MRDTIEGWLRGDFASLNTIWLIGLPVAIAASALAEWRRRRR